LTTIGVSFPKDHSRAGGSIQLEDLSLQSWDRIEDWLTKTTAPGEPRPEPIPTWERKHPDIPLLSDYSKKPDASFWNLFPKNYPQSVRSPVNDDVLEILIKDCWEDWTKSERATAEKAIKRVKGEIPVALAYDLPGLVEKNAASAIENGSQMTDTLADWIRKGFVAGPFEGPPMKKFRANPLMAVVQRTKVRPILNLSSPGGASFNDAVIPERVDKLKMCSAKMFAETLIKAGKASHIAKPDIRDAYKLIPSPKSQWNCYGFSWLGMNFFDSTTVFGSAAAPASFDPLPETVVNIVCTMTNTPKKMGNKTVRRCSNRFPQRFKLHGKLLLHLQKGLQAAWDSPSH
jgi:hypothetical protein